MDEELKTKQRKNAMSVMAHYTLDQNNQRVERENMFREEAFMRRHLQNMKDKASSRVNTDREKMLQEDKYGRDRRRVALEQEERRIILSKSAEAVKRARMRDSGGTGLEEQNLFEGLVPWWARPDVSRNSEEIRIDDLKSVMSETLKDVEMTSIIRKAKGKKPTGEQKQKAAPESQNDEHASHTHTTTHRMITPGLTLQAHAFVNTARLEQRSKLGYLDESVFIES